MEKAVRWATVTVLEVIGSDGVVSGEGGGGKEGGEVIAPSSWGLGCSGNGGGGFTISVVRGALGLPAHFLLHPRRHLRPPPLPLQPSPHDKGTMTSPPPLPPPPIIAVTSALTITTTMVVPPVQGGKGGGGNGGGSALGNCDGVGGKWWWRCGWW